MAITISQGMSIPATLAPGQVAIAQDVINLYNQMNAFIIPSTIGVFQQGAVSDTNIALTIGGTVTNDLVVSVVNTKSILVLVSMDWSGLTGVGSIQLRMNGAAVIDPQFFTNQGSGSGIFWVWIGPHDSNSKRPLIGWTMDSAGTRSQFGATSDLPNATTTSVGFTFGNAPAGVLNLRHTRIWVEG